MPFDYSLDFKKIDFRKNPELYQVGKGEQGVLLVEPYKSEILPHWRFRTVKVAKISSKKIYQLFKKYLKEKDFVGADMARKFLQMGYTRARRYANHASGKKYASNPQKAPTKDKEKALRKKILTQEDDWKTNEKAQAAEIFKLKWTEARTNSLYLKLKKEHQNKTADKTTG